ncbi:MAG: alpha/beta hydrolase fold domain-containing protein, partial [Planctomycetota bacterium]
EEQRRRILNDLKSEEAGLVSVMAQLLAAMTPPHAPGSSEADNALIQPSEWVPGLMKITVPDVLKGRTLTYDVQLPPEYDPWRQYPAVVTLRGRGTSTEQQIDWWAGTYNQQAQLRTGPAARQGYIVIAPDWARSTQGRYEYTANEHAAVLAALRDAMGRFSIDTNRVFLSGHSMGGDAAWDIGLAHPDLWAGVIPISAVATRKEKRDPKYVTVYWENARMVPLYLVGGSKDTERLLLNSREFDRYLKRPHFDTQIVEYLGRGHEHFQDEIHRIFDWMAVHERDFLPTEFEAVTMRPWDSFFWWIELEGLPENATVLPHDWPRGGRALPIKGRVTNQADVRISAGVKDRITVFLAPPLVDFSNEVTIFVSNRRRARGVQPELVTILEDARTRRDRLQPFWAKVEIPLKRQRP